MVTQTPSQSLGDLWSLECEDRDDNDILSQIKALAENCLPEGWREWKAHVLSRKDLLGAELDSHALSKIRFALPTVKLAQAFYPGSSMLSEKKYKEMKFRMLAWPFCVGLIIGPPSAACKVRDSSAVHELIVTSLSDLKPSLVSWEEANRILGAQTSLDDSESLASLGVGSSRELQGWTL